MIKTESDIVALSVKDFFSKEILKFAILPFVITMFIVYSLFFGAASVALNSFDEIHIEQTTTNTSFENINDQTYVDEIGQWFLKSAAISWIVNILVYSIGAVAMVYVSIFISLIVIGFLTPYILAKIRDKHYSSINFYGDISIISTIWYLIKTIIIMFVLFIALIPFYFIPVINIFAINLPFYYLFHKMLNFDVGTTILNTNDLKVFQKENTKELRLRTLKLYLLSMIPFMSLILPIYYVVYIGHGYLSTIQKQTV
jgi:hypothetical protein